jgi:hypothetical protein
VTAPHEQYALISVVNTDGCILFIYTVANSVAEQPSPDKQFSFASKRVPTK